MTSGVERYVGAWVALAVLAAAAFIALVGVPAVDPVWATAALVVGVFAAERSELSFTFERATASFTLAEVAIVCGLLLFPPSHAVVATALGMLLASLSRRLDLLRLAFNVANTTLGTTVAAAVVVVTPAVGPLVDDRPVLGALIGMLAYAVVNAGAIGGLMQRYAGSDARALVREQLPLTISTTFGTTAVGIVLATLLEVSPDLAVFVLAPAAAVYLAARGATRTASLLGEVRADRDRLTRIVDGATDGILLIDRDGTVQVWNAGMARLTGIDGQDAVGRPIAEVLTDDRRVAKRPVRGRWLVDDAHDGAARRELEAQLRAADGSRRAVRESHALVFDDRGRCTGDVVVVRDVTRQQELERLRSDFVARISHELRTPLTPIRGFASVLLRRADALSRDDQRDALERILERADHLGRVVEDLLLVTRLDTGEVRDLVHPRPVDLAQVLRSTIETVRNREPGRSITLGVTPGTANALADPERTAQIVDALLDNACRYAPSDTPVEVELDQDHDDVRVRVIDHGPGIPRDHQETVFERFHRLEDPLTMRTGGVGLGLFLARKLAESMHGRLELAPPTGGGGAEFVLRLPTVDPLPQLADEAG